MTSREKLVTALKNYHSDFLQENEFQKAFLKLLDDPRCFFRDHLPGHITGSAFIIEDTKKFTLLTHHAKLNRWLQPGGHADGDENVQGVALREAFEETGLKNLSLYQKEIFDIDIHTIPARKDFPEHLHYDIRFLLKGSVSEPFTISEESNLLAWKNLDDLPELTASNDSILRMAQKVKLLLGADQQ
jgi:8-oxo-dGTP pyrophosphatase MutT (NUDIX family)